MSYGFIDPSSEIARYTSLSTDGLTPIDDVTAAFCDLRYADLNNRLPDDLHPSQISSHNEAIFATKVAFTLGGDLYDSSYGNEILLGDALDNLDRYYRLFPPRPSDISASSTQLEYQERGLEYVRLLTAEQPMLLTLYGIRRAMRERYLVNACRAIFAVQTAWGMTIKRSI